MWKEAKHHFCCPFQDLIDVEGDGMADMVFRCIQEMDIDNRMMVLQFWKISSVFFVIALSFVIHHIFDVIVITSNFHAALPTYCFEWRKYYVSWLT